MKRRRRSWLRGASWSALGCLLALVVLYAYLTRPARLRSKLLQAFAALPMARVQVGQVTFSPWGGLELTDLELAPLRDDSSLRPAREPATTLRGRQAGAARRSWLRVAHARIRCGALDLLAGRVRPDEVILDGVEAGVVCAPAAEGAQADLGFGANGPRWRLPFTVPPTLPRVRLERADVRLLLASESGVRLLRSWRVSGSGTPTEGGYKLRIEVAGGAAEPLAELHWDRRRGELAAKIDWLDVETAALLAPAPLARVCRTLDLRGQMRLQRAVFAPTPTAEPGAEEGAVGAEFSCRAVDVRLADLRCALPIEEADGAGAALTAAQRFLQVRDGNITLRWNGAAAGEAGSVKMWGSAQLDGAPAEFSVVAQPTASGPRPAGLEAILSAELRVKGLAFPTADQHPAFIKSRHVPGAIRGFLRDYQPRGRINLWLRLTREPAEPGELAASSGRLRVAGEVEALGARCRSHRFPYDFEDVRGWLRLSEEGIFFDGISGRHGSARVRADGRVNHSGHNAGFDLVFRGTTVPLDADLLAALPAQYQRLWQRAAPLGACDAVVTVRREDGPPAGDAPPTQTHVEMRLLAGSLRVRPGERLHAAEGLLTIAQGVMTIHDLHGYLDGVGVRLAGTLDVDGGAEQGDLCIEAADVPLRRRATLDPDQPAAGIEFTGRGDVWGRLRGAALAGEQDAHYAVHVKDGALRGFDPDQSWEQCRGWVRVAGDRQEIVEFEARQGNAWLTAAGTLTDSPHSPTPLSLDVRIVDAPMDRLVSQIVPRRWARSADALGLAGRGTLAVSLRPGGPPAAPPRQTAEIHLTAERMKPSPLPLDLHAVRAHAVLTAERIELFEAVSSHGTEGCIRASGSLGWKDGKPEGEFSVRAEELVISPEMIAGMPAPLSRLLRRLSPAGRLRVDLGRVRIADDHGRRWELAGRLVVSSGRLELGLPLTEFDGHLDGNAIVHADGELDLAASFSIERGQLAGRAIENWGGRLERRAGERWVRLEDLRGRLCGGDALGFVRIDPDSSAYELSLTIQNVRFAEFLPPKQPTDKPPRRGYIEGHIFLRGNAHDAASRNGGGDLRIRGASFLQTPVLAEVAQAGRQVDQPISDALDLVKLHFVWQGATLQLRRAEIESRDLRLFGEGSWNMDSDALDLTLVGAHPRHRPRIALLTDLLESAGQELVQYRIRGTLAAPRVTVEPLHKLSETLQALLRSDESRVRN